MGAHCIPRQFRIAPLHRLKDALVMKLPALRAALDVENFDALFAQQSDDGIDQLKNQRIGCCLGQSEMEIKIRLDECRGILLGAVHDRDSLPQAGEIFIRYARGG